MALVKLLLRQSVLGFMSTLVIAGFISESIQAQAQPSSSPQGNLEQGDADSSTPLIFVQPEWSRRGSPGGGSRKGGSSRRPEVCPIASPSLTALVPGKDASSRERSNQGETKWARGLTVNEYPTFWFYTPYTAPLTAIFVLLDEQEQELYKTNIPLPAKPGVISITLPTAATVKPLEIGKRYKWGFEVLCNTQSPSENLFVKGWVERVTLDPALTNQLKTVTPQKQNILYAAQGIWYEPLTYLGDRLIANPTERAIVKNWKDFLVSVGLEDIADQPIVQRYTPAN